MTQDTPQPHNTPPQPEAAHPTAAIVLIGNELLSGRVEDENGRYLIRELRRLGVELQALHIVPDDVQRIGEAVRRASERWTYVFTSGGVGPTHDDVTIEALSAAFDVEMTPNAGLEKAIQDHFGDDPVQLQAWLPMALVPKGCSLVFNGNNMWPLLVMDNVYVMPGIPELFRAHFEAIAERFESGRFYTRTVYVRMGEGELAAVLMEASAANTAVLFGSYPVMHASDYKVRVTLESKKRDAMTDAFRWLMGRIDRRWIYKVVDD
ncbi:MAG: competence/damage-inducible protein A [Myxococcota bacterium]